MALLLLVFELWDALHPPTDIDYPHYFPVHRALSYLFYLVPVKTGWDMCLTLPRMVWKHIFWWDFWWVSSNSLVDGTNPLNTRVLQCSKYSIVLVDGTNPLNTQVLNVHIDMYYLTSFLYPKSSILFTPFTKGVVLGLLPESLNGLKTHLSKGFLMQFK